MHPMNNQEPLNPLHLSFCNRQAFSQLNQLNVLQYFANPENRFYDHTCNNEHLRMRGLPPAQHARELEKMKGIEYILLQAQEPILFVIRKQMRHSPSTVVPLANYYVIAGVIYQAPDLKSIVESKLLATINSLESAFEECFNYARFHPSVGYSWSFEREPSQSSTSKEDAIGPDPAKRLVQRKEMITDASDRMRANYRYSVDGLIHDLHMKFPLVMPAVTGGGEDAATNKAPPPQATGQPAAIRTEATEDDGGGFQTTARNKNAPQGAGPPGALKKPKLK